MSKPEPRFPLSKLVGRFSLRELLWLILMTGLASGWIHSVRRQLAAEDQHDVVEARYRMTKSLLDGTTAYALELEVRLKNFERFQNAHDGPPTRSQRILN